MKPATALLINNRPFYHPEFSSDIHYEGELVLRICKSGKYVDERFAHKYFDAVTVGIDFTARDLQSKCKEKGWPWEIAKAFDNSAAAGEFLPISDFKKLEDIPFSLHKNGELVQQATPKEMIFSIPKILSHVSKFFLIQKGDYLYTGTPVGVAAVKSGDRFEGFIGDKKVLKTDIT
jgi:2-keto-4-pentenoate hydratase/2-oxohepta-3-ene-1,7-dioic acid hydratase in catechol pathway